MREPLGPELAAYGAPPPSVADLAPGPSGHLTPTPHDDRPARPAKGLWLDSDCQPPDGRGRPAAMTVEYVVEAPGAAPASMQWALR